MWIYTVTFFFLNFSAHEYMNQENGCPELFTKYVACLRDKGFEYKKCYNQRVLFEACASEKIVKTIKFLTLGNSIQRPSEPKRL